MPRMTRATAAMLLLLPLLAGLATGCAGQTKTFNIVVHNNSSLPVTVWLTKDGPPAEKGWYTPDEFLQSAPDERSPGVQLPPGKTADTGNVTGTFPQGTHAVLLVYRAGSTANAPGKSAPLTVPLAPGKSELTVDETDKGQLQVTKPAIGGTTPVAIEH